MFATVATGAATLFVASQLVAADATSPPARSVPAAPPTPSHPGGEAARAILRAANCDRCHGKDYDGLAAPSILAYVQTQDRSAFARVVLDGDIGRGMPGYRGFPLVADHLDTLYDDFAARAAARKPAGAVP
jgi:hypothetical protein